MQKCPFPLRLRTVALLAWLALAAWPGAAADVAPKFYQSAGTRKMAERLEKITRELDPMVNPFVNRARAEELHEQLDLLLAAPPSPDTMQHRFNLQADYSSELVRAGEPEKAIAVLKDLEAYLVSLNAYNGPPRAEILRLRAVCYLRLGEQQNCLAHHNIDSC